MKLSPLGRPVFAGHRGNHRENACVETGMAACERKIPGPLIAACALLALCVAAPAYSQTTAKIAAPIGAQNTAQAAAASGAAAQPQSKPQIVQQIRQEAEAYQATLAKMPIEVQQTVRYYDSSGHLKKTRRTSFRYAPVGATPAPATEEDAALNTSSDAPDGAVLSDGASLPLVFLPGSITHLSLHSEAPAGGPWVVHFQSTPCPSPEVLRRWLESNVVSQCVEGNAYVDPKTGAITRIRMEMGGLPIGFRSLAYPLGVVVLELYNDATFRLTEDGPGAPGRLVPEKAEYVTYTTHGRTVVEQTYEPAPATAQPPASH